MRTKTHLKVSIVMSVFLVGIAPAIAVGGTIYVDADASPGGDGSSWATAYKYLQDALYKPPTGGDQIWVAEGTYYPDEDEGANIDPNDRTETFQLINGVAIKGGYAGYGAIDPNVRDIDNYVTILSGDLDGNDVPVGDPCDLLTEPTRAENSYHVVTGSWTEPNAVLDGFAITAGNANGAYPANFGGGIYNYRGSPTATNCTFSGNGALYGGGMCNQNRSSPTVTNCTFSGNSASSGGGGMHNWAYSSPTVTNCIFSDNEAAAGGGMYNHNFSSSTVTGCTFSGNSADYGGGMYNWDTSNPTVTNCTFSRNSVGNDGGGMCNKHYSSPTVTNCILWGNTASSGAQIYNDGTSSATVSYSDVQGGWYGSGGNNIDADPLFVDADGPDDIVGTEDDDLRLLPGSPCIDAGDNTAVPPGLTTDLDGLPRFRDDPLTIDTGNGTPPIVDMGPYEFGPFCGDPDHPYPVMDFNHDCIVDFVDFALFAKDWLECTKPECD